MIGCRRIANLPRFTHIGDHPKNGEIQMTKMKILSAVIILSAAVATPVFAQDAGVLGPGSGYGFRPQPGPTYHGRAYDRWNFRRAYNQVNGPVNRPIYVDSRVFANPFSNRWDPSWIGDQDPSLNPAD
jgi:hypothetical protein